MTFGRQYCKWNVEVGISNKRKAGVTKWVEHNSAARECAILGHALLGLFDALVVVFLAFLQGC